MGKTCRALWIIGVLLASKECLSAADMDIQLTTADGSTKLSIQNSAAAEVSSVDSLGRATFTQVTGALNGNAATATALTGGANGSLPYQTGSGVTTMLAAGSNGQVIKQAGGVPTWASLTGTDVANVITLQSTLQSGATFYASSGTVNTFRVGTSISLPTGAIPDAALASTPATLSTPNSLAKRDGSGNLTAGTFTGALSGNAATATTATHIAGGASGAVPYQSGAGATAMLAAGNSGQILKTQGVGSAPGWVNLNSSDVSGVINLQSTLQSGATLYVSSGTVNTLTAGTVTAGTFTGAVSGNATTATTATHIAGGANGSLPLQSGSGTTGMLSIGAAGTYLRSNSTVPSWQPIPASDVSGVINLQNTLQAGSTFFVSSGTVNDSLTVGGTLKAADVQMPAGGAITIGGVRGMMVPSGTLILTTSTCPSGFTEYTAAGGYYLVGVPSGGTAGGTLGSAMGNLISTNHNHTITTTTGNFGSNLVGNTSVVTGVTTPTGDIARLTIAPYFQIRLCSVP